MNNTFYFLRHGETKVDKNVPVSQWILSETGEVQAKQLVQGGVFNEIDIIFSSTENKAYKTALPTAKSLGKEVIKLEEIVELNRDNGVFLEVKEYEKTIKQCLEHPDVSFNSWEPQIRLSKDSQRKFLTSIKIMRIRKFLWLGMVSRSICISQNS